MTVGINIKNIYKQYPGNPEQVLKNISFDIKPGEKFGILGPNGAGKTTLISIICNILQSSSGEIIYKNNGKDLSYNQFKQHLGYIPQELAFYEELSPMQNMHFFGAMHGFKKDEINNKAEKILSILGLLNVKKRKAKKFSGGMKRRLNLAISLLHEPKILFLDEPTVGIDVQSKTAIIQFLNELNEQGTTIVYTSHYLEEAEMLCNRILLIDKGQTVALGDVKKLKEKTKTNSLEDLFLGYTGKEYRDNVQT